LKLHRRWLADFLCSQTFRLRTRPGAWFRLWYRLKAGLTRRQRIHWSLFRSPGGLSARLQLSKILNHLP
jgi:hypothetical protein